jgi:uncharacterized oxidoreductase
LTETIVLSPAELHSATTKILEAGGSSAEEACVVADHLVMANASGHDSHGVGMLPAYVAILQRGLLVPNQIPEKVVDHGSIVVYDGKRGYGQAVARIAMEESIERCRETGVVVMALRNAHHVGRIGTYAEQAVAAGLCSMHFVNVTDHGPLVAPYRGSQARFGTNPVTFGMPGTDSKPAVVLDMATSQIAMGKARVAHNSGVPVPEGSVIDSEGQYTTDPSVLFEKPVGSLMPFGLHKGYGLAMFGEFFGGLLSGGGTLQPGNEPQYSIINNFLCVLIDPSKMVDQDWMQSEFDAMVEYTRSSRPADPEAPVLMPGDPERAMQKERAEGIPVDKVTWEQIVEAAEKLGVAL